ncbi:MAG: O-antigen polymerase [Desulfocapsaceae bacterium]|jgi:hypothetical protein|nr:O-antigen polymerase [Desulfocapsaceae bacterium]
MNYDISSNRIPRIVGFSPSLIFVTIFFVFQFAPGLYIYVFHIEENLFGMMKSDYSDAALLYVICVGLFLLTFILTRYGMLKGDEFTRKSFLTLNATVSRYSYNKKLLYLPRFLFLFSLFSILIYFMAGGYEKLMLLGSEMDRWEFRLIGYDDRSRVLTAILQISRRIFLPVAILYYMLLKKIGAKVSHTFILILIFAQLLASSMTMDRAPFFTLLILIGYAYLSGIRGVTKFLKLFLCSFVLIVLVAGIITNLQYNITSFSFMEIVSMGLDFIIHRVWLVPSITPIELSFANFVWDSDKLFLEFARIGALITGNYVGTSEANSIFVTPVGAIGDIWRNFGFTGILIVPFLLGCYFKKLDMLANKVSVISLVVGDFLVIALCFYWVMGVFFSQGAFFVCIMCYLYFKYELILFRISLREMRVSN